MEIKKELYSVPDVAEKLGTTEAAIRMMRFRGQLPEPVSIGSRIRWRAKEFDLWLDSLQKNTE